MRRTFGKGNKIIAAMLTTVLTVGMAWPTTSVCAVQDKERPLPEEEVDEDFLVDEETETVIKNIFLHGTVDYTVTEDMLNNTPPADYEINTEMQGKAKDGRYNDFFLKGDLQVVEIDIDENNLNYLFQNAASKPTVMTNSVTIGGETIGYAGLKTKGSYTLEHTVSEAVNSDRFSFTINFGKYINKENYGDKQNFYGARKISFNNFFFDKSMMKEYYALKLMDEMDLPTPQYGLAKLYINGEYYGVYSMIEAMDYSILEQHYDTKKKELSPYLCKPEGTNFLWEELEQDFSPMWEEDDEVYADVKDMLPTVETWVKRLNQLSEGKDFEDQEIDVNSSEYLELLAQVIDVEESVRYFAVHSWLCQMDNMFVGQKNFGLYIDENGVSKMVPWDYDLSFGCYYPCDAQSTANYNIDVMYRFETGWGGFDSTKYTDDSEKSAREYRRYPLFNVIYQNDELMEKFHAYQKECSKIVSLGGTIATTGKTYEPGSFYAELAGMEEKVYNAAKEEVTDHVYYFNANQPMDMKTAAPNLGKILAMRAVGVYNQVEGIRSIVSGNGCNLATLGNAMEGMVVTNGTISAVDPATGIFTQANYVGNGRNTTSPRLTVKVLDETDDYYTQIREKIGGVKDSDGLIVYSLRDQTNAKSDYTVNIPVSPKALNGESIDFYSYVDGELERIEMEADDNLFTGTVSKLKFIAVYQKGGAENLVVSTETMGEDEDVRKPDGIMVAIFVFAGILVVVVVAVLAIGAVTRKKRSNEKSNTDKQES